MNIKNYILFFLFTTTFVTTRGQIIGPNLVQNPSFEDYFQCPWSLSQLNFAKFWWGASTDYYNVCGINNTSVPSNSNGFQYPHFGNAYAGFLLYWHNALNPGNVTYTETIKNIIKDSLIKNKRYCINYYVSLSEYAYSSGLQIRYDSISAMFSINQVQDDGGLMILCDTCAKYTQSIATLDTINWFKISGSIIANGGEKYLTIGKFSSMNWLPISCEFYIYVDDVSVCECAYNINLGNDTNLCEGKMLALNASLPNATYTWQDSSHAATYEVKQSGTYWVRAYIAEYDITTSDTIVISYSDCNITELFIPNSFTPNGDGLNDKFEYGNASFFDIKTYIYNRWGQLIYEGENTDYWDGSYKGKLVQMDVYNYRIEATDKISKEKKVYSGRVTVIQ